MEKFEELSFEEMQEIEGGGWIEDLKNLVKELDENWDNLKARFMDGWNSYEGTCKCK